MESHVSFREMTAVLPLTPFPPLHWWHLAADSHGDGFVYEPAEGFRRQTMRNRMVISGPQGKTILSFPVQSNEDQGASPLLSAHVSPIHSFRTLQSSYGGAPFFEHFEEELRAMWLQYLPDNAADIKSLRAFNKATIVWVANLCQWPMIPEPKTVPKFSPSMRDLRDKRKLAGQGWDFKRYTQIFEAINGFIPGCSILDALMTLGPASVREQIHFLASQAPNSH